jgi:hypothetical protein
MARLIALLVALLLLPGPAPAHETTRSYLALTRSAEMLRADLRLAFRDLAALIWMDSDLDGALTWAEVSARQVEIAAYAAARLDLRTGDRCTLALTASGASASGGIGYLDLRLDGRCPDARAPLTVASRLFEDIDPDHRLFLTVARGEGTAATILGRDSPAYTVPEPGLSLGQILRDHFAAGVGHLLAGPDHIAFLLLLVLPAVAGGLAPARAAWQVLAAVTAFTLAHALTLSAATLTFLRPPPDLIGALVALTVVLTAADNLRPFLPGPRAAAAAFFGLIHGFGFAGVLADTGLTGAGFAMALFAFNLGIEAGQIAVLAATAFALAALRLGRVLVALGSLAGGLAGTYWLWAMLRTLAETA